MQPALERDTASFSLTRGGPFYHLLERLHLGYVGFWRYFAVAFVVWLPMVVVASFGGYADDPLLEDISIHARILVALPLLLRWERLLDSTSASTIRTLRGGDFLDRQTLEDIIVRTMRLRDSWVIELALLALALTGGQLVLWGAFGPAGLVHGGESAGAWSFPHLWYATIALPLVQFVMYRWLWRWAIWCYLLARVALQPLRLLATHPDHACGLASLGRPIAGFEGFVLATSAVLSGALTTKVLEHRSTVSALVPYVVVFLAAALVVALGPYLMFCGHLFHGRRKTLETYGDLARGCALEFDRTWIGAKPATLAIHDDIAALHYLEGVNHVVAKSRLFVFDVRVVMTVWLAGLVPMLPLFASSLTVEQLLARMVKTVMGGFPL